MSEVKFTKGEWKVAEFVNNKGHEITFNDEGEVIADYVYAKEDAHLIAAAPEMYEALKNMVDMMDSGDEHGEGSDWHVWASNALAKARGEL